MEKKIRIMRRVLAVVVWAALIVSAGIKGEYSIIIGIAIGSLIGLSIRKKAEPDERDVQMDLLASYGALSAIFALVFVMLAVEKGNPPALQAYRTILYAGAIFWALFTVLLKKIWK